MVRLHLPDLRPGTGRDYEERAFGSRAIGVRLHLLDLRPTTGPRQAKSSQWGEPDVHFGLCASFFVEPSASWTSIVLPLTAVTTRCPNLTCESSWPTR